MSVLFSAIVLLQVISNGAEPYRMRPMPEQTESVSLERLGTVRVDAKTATMVRAVQFAAKRCSITPGMSFLDFYDLPGLALVLGAVPVDSPWLLNSAFAAVALKRAEPATLSKSVIAVKLEARGVRPSPPPQLAAFPKGFKLCGSATGPWDGLPIELWVPD
jgi:hypothetical protein